MPANRYYVNAPFNQNASVEIADEEFHHLFRVMRGRMGDEIELVNGKGGLATARIISIAKHHALALIETVTQLHKPPLPRITLGVPLTQTGKLDLIIEKGCELNASAFWLYPAEQSEKKTLTPNQLQRLAHLNISAMKQCGRGDLPSIEVKPPLKEWPPFEGVVFFGDTRPSTLPTPHTKDKPILFITGPEKGFTDTEIAILEKIQHAQGVSLHENILRMETAPLVALMSLSIRPLFQHQGSHPNRP